MTTKNSVTRIERPLTRHEAIRIKMDELLSSGQRKLTCGECADVCSCPTCGALNDALADYMTEFQEPRRGVSPYDQHQNVRRSVAKRFAHDKELEELFKLFVANLWWAADSALPDVDAYSDGE